MCMYWNQFIYWVQGHMALFDIFFERWEVFFLELKSLPFVFAHISVTARGNLLGKIINNFTDLECVGHFSLAFIYQKLLKCKNQWIWWKAAKISSVSGIKMIKWLIFEFQ